MKNYTVSILMRNKNLSDCLTICRVPGTNKDDALTNALIDKFAMVNIKKGYYYVMHVIIEDK